MNVARVWRNVLAIIGIAFRPNTEEEMRHFARVLAAAALILATVAVSAPQPASAQSGGYFSFGFGGPGFSFGFQRYPRYGYAPRYYGDRYYARPYYRYSQPGIGSRCAYWSDQCAYRWGYGGRNYRGCLRYHDCL